MIYDDNSGEWIQRQNEELVKPDRPDIVQTLHSFRAGHVEGG